MLELAPASKYFRLPRVTFDPSARKPASHWCNLRACIRACAKVITTSSCDTLAQSHQVRAVRGAGEVANYAEEQKRRKYATLTPSYAFAPICIETLGAWGDSAKDLVRKIGARVREKTGEPRSTSFLIQRLALDVQRGNAAAVLGTIPATRDWAEVGLLPL